MAAIISNNTQSSTESTQLAVKADLDSIVTNTGNGATAANQTTGNNSLSTIATNTGNIPAKGAATTANSTPVNIASDQTVPVSIAGTVTVTSSAFFSKTTYTVTTSGTQTATDIHTSPAKTWSVSVKGTGAAATTWAVNLEVSLDNANWTPLLTHSNSTGDGTLLASGDTLVPALYYRANVTSLTLGSATNIIITLLGV
jgi:hypothetical protein